MIELNNSSVVIEEQGLRDGLQSEEAIVSTGRKLQIIDALVEAGLKRIQICSFVHPEFVPQLADAEAVCAGLKRKPGIIYSGLVLNLKGVERAIAAGLEHIAVSFSVSDTHSRKNTRMSLEEAWTCCADMVGRAKEAGLTVQGGLQCVFGCRFEGRIAPGRVIDKVKRLLDLGVDELSLADTTGMADPLAMYEFMSEVMGLAAKEIPVFLHLHDTEGKGLANVLAALQVGVRNFDTAFGGMGGCPFIKGATGNISTEDLGFMLEQMGVQTGIDLSRVAAVSASLEAFFEKQFTGKMHHILHNENLLVLDGKT